MKIGVPREIKANEHRVGLTPGSIKELAADGHAIFVETDAGAGIGALDDDYRSAGAEIVADAAAVFANSELIVKVKEPQVQEIALLTPHHALFTYLHLAADRELTCRLRDSGATAIAYETVTSADGTLPLLTPMSEVAGRLSIQAGAKAMEFEAGGAGILLGGVPGVEMARVVVVGGGVVGTNAIEMAVGLGASVTVLDRSLSRLRALHAQFGSRLNAVFATKASTERHVRQADLVIGAVLVPGAAAPKLIERSLLKKMKRGSVIVDVAIDQGGCAESSRPTTHADPTYVVDGVVHYCVANIPGAVPKTSTSALNNATLPYVQKIARSGVEHALTEDAYFRSGLNVYRGMLTEPHVAEAFGLDYQSPDVLLRSACGMAEARDGPALNT